MNSDEDDIIVHVSMVGDPAPSASTPPAAQPAEEAAQDYASIAISDDSSTCSDEGSHLQKYVLLVAAACAGALVATTAVCLVLVLR